jgi:hypothetical protein
MEYSIPEFLSISHKKWLVFLYLLSLRHQLFRIPRAKTIVMSETLGSLWSAKRWKGLAFDPVTPTPGNESGSANKNIYETGKPDKLWLQHKLFSLVM